MSGFRFTLQKALDLRRRQLELEEARFQQQMAALLELDRLRGDLRVVRADAEAQIRDAGSAQGFDLAALGAFRLHMESKEQDIAQRRRDGEKKLDELRAAMLDARRRCRLLERLRVRREDEWQTAFNRELEEVAAESFLARWNRGKA